MTDDRETQVSVRVPVAWMDTAEALAAEANQEGLRVPGVANPIRVKRTHVLRMAIQQGMRHALASLRAGGFDDTDLA